MNAEYREPRAGCGWCGKAVLWSVEGEQHLKGVCVDPTLELWKSRQREAPRTRRARQGIPPPVEAMTYLTGRVTAIADTDSRVRPRWTLRDVEAARAVLRHVRMSVVA